MDRLAVRERPRGRPVMRQIWSDLTFLHWEVEPSEVQMRLPDGLRVDTYEGKTYVGLVPFTMTGVRPVWSPSIPGLSNFHETNVRVYVIGPGGIPGVWFCSLEAANPIVVAIAKAWFGLPYWYARMSLENRGEQMYYESRRSVSGIRNLVEIEGRRNLSVAEPGSLEFWLIERYVLFSMKQGQLMSGQVWHEPYQVSEAKHVRCEGELVKAAGFEVEGNPKFVHWSPGVSVDVFKLARA